MRLEGKTAIITGAASGMGAEEARLFAREGCKVIVADVSDELGESVVEEVGRSGGDAYYMHSDVTSMESWESTVSETIGRFGAIDILVNNAGLSSSFVQDDDDFDAWQKLIDVNLNGVFLGTRAVLPAMKSAGRGSIVNISSISGYVGSAGGHPGYFASKGGVRTYTKAMAFKHGPDGIRVNSVHPGVMPPMRSAAAFGPRVTVMNTDGEVVGRAGTESYGSQPGRFFSPHGIAVDSHGDIYVAEVAHSDFGRPWNFSEELRSMQKMVRVL